MMMAGAAGYDKGPCDRMHCGIFKGSPVCCQKLIQVIQQLQKTVALRVHAFCCARCVLICCGVPHGCGCLAEDLTA